MDREQVLATGRSVLRTNHSALVLQPPLQFLPPIRIGALKRNAIIIGASSGIGAALAVDLAAAGYSLGLVARRLELLEEVARQLPTSSLTRAIDIADTIRAIGQLAELIKSLGDVELFVISAGTGFRNPDLEWTLEDRTVQTNVVGFVGMANAAARHLETRGSGHLVGISSIAAIRGNAAAPAYGASKAFMSHYLQSLRHRFAKAKLPICVTDVKPGFVDTAMAKADHVFWVASPEKASRQILQAIRQRRKHVYITRRWRTIAWLMRWAPDWFYHRT